MTAFPRIRAFPPIRRKASGDVVLLGINKTDDEPNKVDGLNPLRDYDEMATERVPRFGLASTRVYPISRRMIFLIKETQCFESALPNWASKRFCGIIP